MKNHKTYWEHVKKHGKRIVTVTVIAGSLILPWHAAEAELLALADSNRNEYSVLSVGIPSEGRAHGIMQLSYHMSLYDLQTNAYAPTFLRHRASAYVTAHERGLTIAEDAVLVVFSW